MTRPEDEHCQCARVPLPPCSLAITQEDLLCDTCRAGCNAVTGVRLDSPDSAPAAHIRITDFRWELQHTRVPLP